MLEFLAANSTFIYMLTRKHGYRQPRQIICAHSAFAGVLELKHTEQPDEKSYEASPMMLH